MFYLRAVTQHSYFAPASFNLERAIAGLSDRNEGPLSVFKVDGQPQGIRVVTVYAMFGKQRPDYVSYVMFAEELIALCGLNAQAGPSDIPHELMHLTHHEILGLELPEARRQLAEAIRDDPNTILRRIHAKRPTDPVDFRRLVPIELADPQWGRQAAAIIDGKPLWHDLIR